MFGTSTNTSGGLFGGNSNSNATTFGAKPAAPSTGFSFGSNTGNASTTTNSFGTNTAANSTGGLFGAKPATTGFGSATNSSAPAFGATSNSTAPAFGSTNTSTAPGFGSTFGSSNATNTSTAPSTFGGFGNTQATNTSGGLFGNNANASNTASGGLFGTKPATTATTGGLFGSTNNASTGSGGLFGNNTSNTATTGGLFGSSNTSNTGTTSGGLFGAKPATTGTTGGLFGNTMNNSTGATTGGLFGNNATNTSGGLFGNQQQQQQQQQQQPQQQQQQGGLFGNNNINNPQPSFGWTTNKPANTTNASNLNSMGNMNASANLQANTSINTYAPAINDQLVKVKEQWDPTSPKCILNSHFYNKLSEQEISVLMNQPRPNNETPEDWDKAMNERPSPLHYPVKVTSFEDVAQRVETQIDHVGKSRVLLNNIYQRQQQLSSKHDLDNTTRILRAKARHTKLSRRLLRLATVLAILKLKGYPLLPEEEEISKQFDLLNSKLNDPNSSIGKLNDIFARLAILKDRADDLNNQFDNSISIMNQSMDKTQATEPSAKKEANTDEVIAKLSKVLLKQQIGLNYLNEILEKDLEAVTKPTR